MLKFKGIHFVCLFDNFQFLVFAKLCMLRCFLSAYRLEPVAKSGYVIADPGLPDAVKAVAADFTEDFDLQGFHRALIRSSIV